MESDYSKGDLQAEFQTGGLYQRGSGKNKNSELEQGGCGRRSMEQNG